MRFLLSFILFSSIHFVIAQQKTPILERKITVSFSNEKLGNALQQISQQAKFSFSYSSSIVAEEQHITLSASQKTVREVLNAVFNGTMNYKEKGNHLILTKAPVKTSQVTTTVVVVSGYVEDAQTKEKLADASVYDKKSVTAVVTDQYGFFKMKLDQKDQKTSIAVSKKDYKDTLVSITAPGNQYLTISIAPIQKDSVMITAVTSDTPPDSVKQEKKDEEEAFVLPYSDEPNILNIRDTLYREVQFSFLPFIGTNAALSGNVINDYSFNLVGGYSMGTRKMEIGAFFNLDRGNVRWLQLAGFANLVTGEVLGVQGAGFFNLNGGTTTAVQLAGYGNINFKDFTGVQFSGFGNVNLQSTHGVSVAGFANVTQGVSRGFQIAGFANVQGDNYTGSQIAGFANVATQRIEGSQVSAFFNYGTKVRGSQISLFNAADSLEGVAIGLLSFVKHGYHKIEVSADEAFYLNMAYRTGVKQFYNFLLAGMQPKPDKDDDVVWTFGYGVGTAPRLTRWLDLNIDASAQQVNKGSFTEELSILNKVSVGVDFQLLKKLSIYTGVTFNCYLTKSTYTDYPVLFADYQPNVFYNKTETDNTNTKLWWGGKIGIRFL